MPDASVLDATTGLRVAEKVIGVAQRLPQQHSVSAGPPGAHQEGRNILQREGAAHHGLKLVADVGVLIVAGLAAAGLFSQHLLVDGLQLLGCVLVAAGHACVLAPLPGGSALVTGAPTDDAGHQLIALVGVDRLHELDHQGLGVAALALLHVQHTLDAVDRVAGADVPEILPVVAGEKTVDARQAPPGAPRPVAHVRSAGVADDGAVLGIGGVFLVSEYGVGVADTIYKVQESAQRGITYEVLGAHAGADHCAGAGDGLGGYAALDFRQRFDNSFTFVPAGHLVYSIRWSADRGARLCALH